MKLPCCSIVLFLWLHISLYDPVPSIWWESRSTSVDGIGCCFIHGSPTLLFGYINERIWNHVKRRPQSECDRGECLRFSLGPNLFGWPFLWDCSSLFEWDSSHDGKYCNTKSCFWEDSRLGEPLDPSVDNPNSRLGLAASDSSPQAVYIIRFLITIFGIFCLSAVRMKKKRNSRRKRKNTYLFVLLMDLISSLLCWLAWLQGLETRSPPIFLSYYG